MGAEVRKVVRAFKAGLITEAEVAIELARLVGVDISCDMGECRHDARAGR